MLSKIFMQKGLAVLLVSAMLISSAACGKSTTLEGSSAASGTGTGAGDKKVVTFFHRWPNEPKNSIYEAYVAEFEQLHPDIEIQMDCVLNDSYKEKVRVLVSGDSIPDVFSSWSGSFAENLVTSGNVKQLDELMAADKAFADSIISSQLEQYTFDGKLYGLPMSMDGKAFFYNKDVFTKEGLEVPKTLDELYAVMDKLTAAGYKTPLIEGLADAWTVSHYEGTLIQRMLDPAVMAKDTNKKTGEFTDPGYVEALNIFKKLTSYMGEAAPAMDHEAARNMFISSEVPLFYAQLAEIRLINGDTSVGGGASFEYGFFNFPSIAGGKGDQTGLTGAPEGFMLSNKAKNPAEAELFFKFLLSKQAGEKITKEAGELSCIQGAVNPETATTQQMEAVEMIMSATSSVPWYDNAVEASIGDAFMRGGQSLAIGDMTAEEIMKNVQSVATEVRDANK